MNQYNQLVERQRKYWMSGETRTLSFRLKSLKKLKREIYRHYDDIIEALKKDFGKAEFETLTTEIAGTLDEISMAIKRLHLWMKPERVKTPLTLFKATSRVYKEPYGCVFIITAWNYPFLLAMAPLVGAIAAGNCCIMKPSELAPETSDIIRKIIENIYSKEYCMVVEGGVEETTGLLKEKFDLIHYTGGEYVGKIVAQAAAKNLTPVILELGGKSPCIVDETADIKLAAGRILWGKFVNAGQTCVAPDYLLVHEAVKAQLLEALKTKLAAFYGEKVYENNDYCRIINIKHFERLMWYLDNLNEGKIIEGGIGIKKRLYIEPTIIDHVKWEDPIMQEEIFGPILPILTYNHLDEVINKVNSGNKPLALYFFSNSKQKQKKIIKNISFGGGCMNGTLMHTANPYLPFGGVGNSGMGCYHGKWGFDAFSHKKGVLKRSAKIDISLLYPPYKMKEKLIKKFYLKK